MYYLTYKGWIYYSPGHPKTPKFYLDRKTPEEYAKMLSNGK